MRLFPADYSVRHGIAWWRIYRGGPGLWIATYARWPVLFSERNGYVRVHRLGNWARWRFLRSYDCGPSSFIEYAQRKHNESPADI